MLVAPLFFLILILYSRPAQAGLGLPLTCEGIKVEVISIGNRAEGRGVLVKYDLKLKIIDIDHAKVINPYDWASWDEGTCQSFYDEHLGKILDVTFSYNLSMQRQWYAQGKLVKERMSEAIEEKEAAIKKIQPGDKINIQITHNADEWNDWYSLDAIDENLLVDFERLSTSWLFYLFCALIIIMLVFLRYILIRGLDNSKTILKS